MIAQILPYIAILPASVYSLLAIYCAEGYFRDEKKRLSSIVNIKPLPVTIIKPVKGGDENSYVNFSSFIRQNYAGAVQLIFAVASPDDTVLPVIGRLIADFPEHDIELVINPALHGANYKVSNLVNAFPKAKYDLIIVCDSDINVNSDYLSSVTAHFANEEVGLVMSLYRTSDVDSVAAALESSGFTVDMIPNVLVARRLEGLSFALGASMAVRRKALENIGGFSSLNDYLADDYQLGNKIHLAGWQLRLDSCFVESTVGAEELMTVLSRQLRWARTMRVSRPGGYLASGITLTFPGLMLSILASAFAGSGYFAAPLLLFLRMFQAVVFSQRHVHDRLFPRWLWLLPVRDMLTFCCWGLSFLGNRVEWRGSRFILKKGGELEELV